MKLILCSLHIKSTLEGLLLLFRPLHLHRAAAAAVLLPYRPRFAWLFYFLLNFSWYFDLLFQLTIICIRLETTFIFLESEGRENSSSLARWKVHVSLWPTCTDRRLMTFASCSVPHLTALLSELVLSYSIPGCFVPWIFQIYFFFKPCSLLASTSPCGKELHSIATSRWRSTIFCLCRTW